MFLVLRLPIIALFYFYFLHIFVSTFATTNFHKLAVDNCHSFDNNPAIFTSKPGKLFLAFGRVNGTVNVVIIVLCILNIIVYKLRQLRESNSGEKLDKFPEQLCRRFSIAEMLSATNNFEESLIIGKGGFGMTYKGVIYNGTRRVAIKRLKPMSKQGAPEFHTEIAILTKVRHCHVISLIGYCDSENEMMLVYEYMDRGTFADHLYKRGGNGDDCRFSWVRRLEICIEAARAIDYLHTGSCDGIQHVIHRDVKSSNILLDDNWKAKISDFGYSTIGPTNTTSIKGTVGYRDPARKLTVKSDVYAFGVVLFEALSGRPAVDIDFYMDQWLLARWAQRYIKKGKVDEIIDPNLRGEVLQGCLSVFVQIANQCIDDEPEKRPTMVEVVIRLENALAVQDKEAFTEGRAYESPDRVGSRIVEGGIIDSGGTYGRQDYEDSSVVERNIFNSGGSYHTEIEVSSTFDEICNAGGTYEHQELEGSSIFEEEISNAGGTCENQELEGSSVVEDEISNADNGVHQDEKIDGIIQFVEGNGTESPTKAKGMKFTKKARIFLFGSERLHKSGSALDDFEQLSCGTKNLITVDLAGMGFS